MDGLLLHRSDSMTYWTRIISSQWTVNGHMVIWCPMVIHAVYTRFIGMPIVLLKRHIILMT